MKTTIKSPKYGELHVYFDRCDKRLILSHVWSLERSKNTFYAKTWVKSSNGRKYVSMHRMIMNFPEKMEVDHIDHNGLNNKRNNLRIGTKAQNSQNQQIKSSNTIGFKGVKFSKRLQLYGAVIGVNNKSIFGGYFASPFEAARKYNELAIEHHKEFAFLNIIDPEKEKQFAMESRIAIPRKTNTTGFVGVFVEKRRHKKKFYAKINVNKKVIRLGYFYSANEAANAYNEGAIKYLGKYAIINKIPNE